MEREQSVHSPDAVPGLMACMQCATRAAAACTTAGEIWACSACVAMTTCASSFSSGFSILEYCKLSKLSPEGASEPLLASGVGAVILHVGQMCTWGLHKAAARWCRPGRWKMER